MKNILLLVFLLFVVASIANSQTLLLEENFSYTLGDTLSNNGWTAYGAIGTNPPLIVAGLTYSGYASSGIGNA